MRVFVTASAPQYLLVTASETWFQARAWFSILTGQPPGALKLEEVRVEVDVQMLEFAQAIDEEAYKVERSWLYVPHPQAKHRPGHWAWRACAREQREGLRWVNDKAVLAAMLAKFNGTVHLMPETTATKVKR